MNSIFDDDNLSPADRSGAVISECGRYRYHLWRRWDSLRPTMVWVMLNPSTADATVDDPTIRRCIGFAKREGCGGISVRNVFALRATDPSELAKVDDPFGPENEDYLMSSRYVSLMTILVAGWGKELKKPLLRHYYKRARVIVAQQIANCFGMNADGSPRHPLYLPADAPLIRWPGPEGV